MDKKARRHVFFKGKVQGVFFRQSAKQKADELEITGWICNLNDGRVEAVFEGDKERMKLLLGWLKNGPGFWEIDNIQSIAENFKNEFKEFEIKR